MLSEIQSVLLFFFNDLSSHATCVSRTVSLTNIQSPERDRIRVHENGLRLLNETGFMVLSPLGLSQVFLFRLKP